MRSDSPKKARKTQKPRNQPAASAKPPGEPEPLHQLVCSRVHRLRKKKGWTLEQLASLSGVSRSMLSQIERGGANPTLAVAYRIAEAFGMKLGELVDLTTGPPKIHAIRGADDRHLFRDDNECRIRTLSPLHLEKDVEFYELTLKPNGVLESASHFEGAREFLTVEKGALRVTSGNETCDLNRGDSAQYAADVPHRIENIGRGEAVAFLVVIYSRGSGASL